MKIGKKSLNVSCDACSIASAVGQVFLLRENES